MNDLQLLREALAPEYEVERELGHWNPVIRTVESNARPMLTAKVASFIFDRAVPNVSVDGLERGVARGGQVDSVGSIREKNQRESAPTPGRFPAEGRVNRSA